MGLKKIMVKQDRPSFHKKQDVHIELLAEDTGYQPRGERMAFLEGCGIGEQMGA